LLREAYFSRVNLFQVCNGGDFVVVTQEVMHQLAQSSQQIAWSQATDDDSRWEEAEGFSSESDAYSEEGTVPPCVLQYRSIESGVVMEQCRTRKGVRIHVDAVPAGVLEQVQKFHVCEDCGKCYWDGSHFERLVGGRLQNIVT
jgi:phosphoribulokinase